MLNDLTADLALSGPFFRNHGCVDRSRARDHRDELRLLEATSDRRSFRTCVGLTLHVSSTRDRADAAVGLEVLARASN